MGYRAYLVKCSDKKPAFAPEPYPSDEAAKAALGEFYGGPVPNWPEFDLPPEFDQKPYSGPEPKVLKPRMKR